MVTLDGTQSGILVNWRPQENQSAWLYPYSLLEAKAPTSGSIVPNILSDSLPAVAYTPIYNGTVGVSIVSNNTVWGVAVRVPTEGLNTISAINEYLASNPIQVVYELATSQTIQLTPQEVELLLGENNVWADTGDIKVIYEKEMPASGNIEYLTAGSKIITYTATDECGNQTVEQRIVYVLGDTPQVCMAEVCTAHVACEDNQ